MHSTIVLSDDERKSLLGLYRHSPEPEVSHRAHIVLLLARGYPWASIAAILFTSSSTIARWQRRFHQGGVAALAGQPRGRRPRFCWHWAALVVGWVSERSPRDFGFLRSR